MDGSRVIVKTYRNRPVVRRIWEVEVKDGGVLITDELYLARLQEEHPRQFQLVLRRTNIFFTRLCLRQWSKISMADKPIKWAGLKQYLIGEAK